MQVAEGPQRDAPAFFTIGAVGDESEVSEEGIHVLAVTGGCGRRRVVERVQFFLPVHSEFPPPEDFSGASVEAQGDPVVAIGRGEKDSIAHHNWR